MLKTLTLSLAIPLLLASTQSHSETTPCPSALDFQFRPLAGGEPVHLCEKYQGKVLLVVNTASYCGFTGQYKGLEALYDTYKDQGLVVLGFPANNFANQEPDDETTIKDFCERTYRVSFPMFEKIHVTKSKGHPFYHELARQGGGYPKWNFYKYVIDRQGRVIGFYSSMAKPDNKALLGTIKQALQQKPQGDT